ncbi:LysE family translocator [Pseudoxanthomonas dokdonensis]|uniref:Lysine transporter LysE n=1 Tax=Pseudoxanthomonas dokdonensis TaxID=344882 RepID=A0A0R0CZC8_9GAMM|nr:LysE family transporter [Pseudoxanthomonas dokdonensis]KRG71534.1 hypothetical protein ABB29_01810 [Pseudoxanthomonas dokdonensis]
MSAVAALVLIATITPGPNNLVLLHSGLNRPFTAGVPLMLGTIAGGCGMLLLVSLAMSLAGPSLQPLLPWLSLPGACFLLFMAWRLWTASTASTATASDDIATTATGFWSMAGLQLVNPKGWAFLASLAAMSVGAVSMSMTIAVFAIISLLSSLTWLLAGRLLQRLFASPPAARLLNRLMAASLLAMALLLLLHHRN